MARKPVRRPGTVAAVNAALNAEAEAKEHAAFLAAEQDPAIIAAAGIVNGMPADEVKRRILAALYAGSVAEG